MRIKSLTRFLSVCGIAAFASFSLAGCGGSDNQPQGPELGALEQYLNENPELMNTADEEMDMIEGDEFEETEEDQ